MKQRIPLLTIWILLFATAAFAADLQLPDKAVAGQGIAIGTSGSGETTLYVVGPGTAIKRTVRLGEQIQLKGEEMRNAGYYEITLKGGDSDSAKQLYIAPAAAEKINFLARPSRVPVGQPKVIAGTAFVFDQYEKDRKSVV